MSDIQTSTIRVPKNVLEDIKIYCRKAGQPVGEWVEKAWRFLQKNDFDIYDTEATPFLPVPAEVEKERSQVDALCKLMSEFIISQKQAQLPPPDIQQKATDRIAELEHLIGKYQEKLDSLSEDKTRLIKERLQWEQKYYGTGQNMAKKNVPEIHDIHQIIILMHQSQNIPRPHRL